MSWTNWGHKKGQWSIDHIKPLITFNLSEREQFLKANHYTNLQPLWVEQNLQKMRKYSGKSKENDFGSATC